MHNIVSFVYLFCFFIAAILLLNIISKAFNSSFLWGIISILFPPGTYVYCKKHWELTKHVGYSYDDFICCWNSS